MDAQKAAGEACSDPILTDASVKTETKATSSEADIEKKLEKATSELEKAEAKLKDAQNALDKANAVLDKANAELKAAKTESEIKRANQAVDRANDGVDTAQMLVKACTARVVELTQNLTNLEKVQTGQHIVFACAAVHDLPCAGAKPSMSLDTFPRDLADALPDVDVGKGGQAKRLYPLGLSSMCVSDYKRVKDGIDSTLQEFRERKQEAKTTSSGLSKKDAKLSSLGTFSVPSNFFLSLPKGLTDVRLKHPFVVRNDMLARLNLILQWQEEKWPTVPAGFFRSLSVWLLSNAERVHTSRSQGHRQEQHARVPLARPVLAGLGCGLYPIVCPLAGEGKRGSASGALSQARRSRIAPAPQASDPGRHQRCACRSQKLGRSSLGP